MAMALDILVGVMLALGSFLILTGAIGVMRFPDFYTRMHAAGVTDTLGATFIIGALMILAGLGLVLLKLLFILLFILLTSPTASHALAKAAQHGGLEPVLGKQEKS